MWHMIIKTSSGDEHTVSSGSEMEANYVRDRLIKVMEHGGVFEYENICINGRNIVSLFGYSDNRM